MTVCTRCAKNGAMNYRNLAYMGRAPTLCVHCKRTPLNTDPEARRWPTDRLEHWMCGKCQEGILHRHSNICLNCGRPLNETGYFGLRHAQRDPSEMPAYLRKERGRRIA